jgi:hypothetical protein
MASWGALQLDERMQAARAAAYDKFRMGEL